MTYTTVHKDYVANTFGEAAELLLRDTEVWEMKHVPASSSSTLLRGEHKGYALVRWEWNPSTRTLRGHFR